MNIHCVATPTSRYHQPANPTNLSMHSTWCFLYTVGLFAFWSCFGPSVAVAQKWEKIIDNGQPGYSETGNSWATWTVGGYNNNYRYLSHQNQGIKRVGTATWQVSAPYDGQYEVSVHFRQTVNRTTDADYNVYDGNGKTHHFSLNQSTLPTGWHKLGTFYWKKGQMMKVVLDGTDDTQSDEADATRWTYSNNNPPPPPPPTQKCTQQQPGTYTLKQYAGKTTATGDWQSSGNGAGPPDNKLISSPNVDSGEIITASDFQFCTPPGSFKITGVRIGVLAKTQYDAGRYKLLLYLEGGGKRFSFSQTGLNWVYGDITAVRPTWTINDLNALTLKVGLNSHPGGARDSDAWVDSFVIEATYLVSGTTCPAGQTLCAGQCSNLSLDRAHCGACGQACQPTEQCTSGQCRSTCPQGQLNCSGQCVDPSTDNLHCGACARPCPQGQLCSQAQCKSTCAPPLKQCGALCVDTQNSELHCGACDRGCQEGEQCVAGTCNKQCTPTETKCSDLCVDLQNNVAHCGTCAKSCQPNETCTLGQCVPQSGCTAQQLECFGRCIDITQDTANCGGCGHLCKSNQQCVQSVCLPELPGQESSSHSEQTLPPRPDAGNGSPEALLDLPQSDSPTLSPRGRGCTCAPSHTSPHSPLVLLLLFSLVALRRQTR